MNIFVTGGAGYIGSHTVLQLLREGHDVVVLDNLSNASEESLSRVKELCGKEAKLYVGDILDKDILEKNKFLKVIFVKGGCIDEAPSLIEEIKNTDAIVLAFPSSSTVTKVG